MGKDFTYLITDDPDNLEKDEYGNFTTDFIWVEFLRNSWDGPWEGIFKRSDLIEIFKKYVCDYDYDYFSFNFPKTCKWFAEILNEMTENDYIIISYS